MRKKNRWTEETALQSLRRNGGKLLNDKEIVVPAPGIKLLGAMDFLAHKCGFRVGLMRPKES